MNIIAAFAFLAFGLFSFVFFLRHFDFENIILRTIVQETTEEWHLCLACQCKRDK